MLTLNFLKYGYYRIILPSVPTDAIEKRWEHRSGALTGSEREDGKQSRCGESAGGMKCLQIDSFNTHCVNFFSNQCLRSTTVTCWAKSACSARHGALGQCCAQSVGMHLCRSTIVCFFCFSFFYPPPPPSPPHPRS